MDATLTPTQARPSAGAAPIGFVEFVALVAALMALGALGIDSMLPALPAIARSLGVEEANSRQFVITAFVLPFGLAQLVHGPLTDRFGRRRVLLVSLGAYAIANIACALAGSFALLLVARACGGAVIAATRVANVAMVRDCFAGRAMARVMSIAFTVFMIVPVLAPSFGQGVLLFGNWRLIFASIAVLSTLVGVWFWRRMPETMHPEDRLPLAPRRILAGWRTAVTDRWSLGYSLASGALLGGMYGYLNSIEQVMEAFGRPRLLTLVFALTAGTMAAANLLNARAVMRLGTRFLSHVATTLVMLLAAAHLVVGHRWGEPLAMFVTFQALTMGCFGLAAANFSAMAMQNMGHVAGTASSVQGFASVTIGALIGAVVGQAFDGTPWPMVTGFLLSASAAFVAVAVTERGRLFRPS